MKVQVTQENLAKALSVVSRIASNRTTLPILDNILIRTEDGQLSLVSTNLEIFITNQINAKIEKTGVVTVPANLVTEFVSNLPKTNIELSLEDNKLKITAGNYKSNINTVSPEDFPGLPESKETSEIKIKGGDFKKAMSQALYCASSDVTRPVLTGVYIYVVDGQLYIVATDGYRLAEKFVMNEKTEINTIVPASTINEVVRNITDDNSDIVIKFNDEQIIFEIASVTVISRLIDGNFVNYRQLIPTEVENTAKMSKADFAQAVKVTELFARESAESITINFDEEKQVVLVKSITSEFGENQAEIEAEVTGSASTTLNAKYLLNALSSFDGDSISLGFSGKLTPILLTGEKDDYKHIIMPVKS